jgi:AcrR family transcriptional regulator
MILETALKVFSRQGYFDTTTKEIAKESNIYETTLFYHFPDKTALYQAVIDKYYYCSETPLLEVDRKLTYINLGKDLYELAVTYCGMTIDNIDILRIILGQIPASPAIKQESFCVLPQIGKHFESYLLRAIDKKLIPSKEYLLPQELFTSHITRMILDLNVHSHVYKLTKNIKAELYPQLEKMCQFYTDNFFI